MRLHPIAFPDEPIGSRLAEGRVVYRHGAGSDRTLMADRAVLGTWFDGRIRRAVDTATWVSPELASRWLGYLADRDGWSKDETRGRWTALRRVLNGKLTFIVRLAAFPKLDPMDFGIDSPPKPESLRSVRFRLSYVASTNREPVVLDSQASCAAQLEKYDAASITGRPFYSLTGLNRFFMGDGEVDPPDDGLRLGDYYGAVYAVTFPFQTAMSDAESLELTVILPTKREHGRFALAEWPTIPPRAEDEDD